MNRVCLWIAASAVATTVSTAAHAQQQVQPLPAWTMTDDRTKAVVQFPSTPPVALAFDAKEAERLLASLADMRAQMAPPRPMVDAGPGDQIHVAPVGRWRLERNASQTMLAILHPGYGWVAILLTPQEAEQMGRALSPSMGTPIRAQP